VAAFLSNAADFMCLKKEQEFGDLHLAIFIWRSLADHGRAAWDGILQFAIGPGGSQIDTDQGDTM
jgi:hypothetical protein